MTYLLKLIIVIGGILMMSIHVTESKPYTPKQGKGKYILTPKSSDKPRINSAKVFGVRPGNPFLFTIAATGIRPMEFYADNLPNGLVLDKKTGRITGRISKKGEYKVTFKVKNSKGIATQVFRIKCGETICLTPPLGWNSWNCWTEEVSQEKVLASAKAMVDKGLINYGWTYINIDDAWQGIRGGKFNAIQPNKKFPDMKKLCNDIHAMGLKAGIYSTPWEMSYAGFMGGSSDNKDGTWPGFTGQIVDKGEKFKHRQHAKYKFDEQDAGQWAEWGFDYLKYDWKPNDPVNMKKMADALRKSGRDIVYSLANTGSLDMADDYVKMANCWRTTGDIRDVWDYNTLTYWAFKGVADIWRFHPYWKDHCGPGYFPDADMLVVGSVGWREEPHPTNLTPDEQYTHITLWCLWASPLLIGCPIEQMDDFTLNLLCNYEVLEVSQDPLGLMASIVTVKKQGPVYVKKLQDGSFAVGIFNGSDKSAAIGFKWSELGIKGEYLVRDIWRQKDIGLFDNIFSAKVNPHGVVLVRLIKK